MASFITRLLSRFKGQKRGQRNRRALHRKLRVERVEMRRLLAGDVAAIAGNVFTDLTDNGLDVSDTAIVGTDIYLYRDGGDNTFNSGGGVQGGDDTLVGTQTTDTSGNYRFDDLIPGRYFVEQEPVAGRLQRTVETVKTLDITSAMSTGVGTLNIDDFNTSATSPDPLTATSGTSASDQVATAAGEALGGERDILVNNTSGANDIDVRVNSGVLSINAGTGTAGNVIISYDGVDGSATTLDHTSLGPVDLTAGGGERSISWLARKLAIH